MPPPPVPINTDHANESSGDDSENKKKLETPLAAMLPSKYADIDVTELFPDFRHGKVNYQVLVLDNQIYFFLIVGATIFAIIWARQAKQFTKHLA